MAISLKKMCEELNIDPDKAGDHQLHVLEKWCHRNISSDVFYTGDVAEKYQQYITLARDYLDGFLVSMPKNPGNASSFVDMNVIQYAAYQGYDHYLNSLKVADSLWSEGNVYGMTPLHLAAVSGHVHTVEVLLNKGADANKLNRVGQMPIFSALLVPIMHDGNLIKRKTAIFRMLEAKTFNIDGHKDTSGDTVLHLIAAYNFFDLAKELLIRNKKLAFLANNALVYPIHTALLNNRAKIAQLLLNIDKVATIVDGKGRTALHYAAAYASPKLVELCCAKTSDLNSKDRDGNSALILAAQAGNTAAVKCLIEKGADVSSENFNGYSVLHYAVKAQDKELVRWLLARTVLGKMDSHGTVLSLADNSSGIHALLVEHGAKSSGLSV